jgi:hypothetical protein
MEDKTEERGKKEKRKKGEEKEKIRNKRVK